MLLVLVVVKFLLVSFLLQSQMVFQMVYNLVIILLLFLLVSDAVSVRPLTPARVGFGYFLYCVLAGLPPHRRQYSKSPRRRPPLRGPPTSGPTTPAPQGAQPQENSADHARSTPRDN